MASYADDFNRCIRNPSEMFGGRPHSVFVIQNEPTRTYRPRINYSERVVSVRVLRPSGIRVRLHPIPSLQLSRLLNRTLGILFASDGREVPTEVRTLFQIRKFSILVF